MALQTNQVNDIFQTQLGRPATDYETKTFSTSSPQTLATLKDTYGKLNKDNSLVDYLKFSGKDPESRVSLGQQYGINNVGTPEGNTALLNALKGGKPPVTTPVGGSITPPIDTTAPKVTETTPTIPQTPTVPGTIAGAAKVGETIPGYAEKFATGGFSSSGVSADGTTPTPQSTDPLVQLKQTVDSAYQQQQETQKKVSELDSQINTLNNQMRNTVTDIKNEVAKSGGTITDSEANLVANERNAVFKGQLADLMGLRKQYASEYTQANQNYQKANSDYKNAQTLTVKEEQLAQGQQKIDIQQQQFAQKIEQAGWKTTKINVTDAAGNVLGQKVVWSQNPANKAEVQSTNQSQFVTTTAGSGDIKNGVTNVGNTAELPKLTIAEGATPDQVLQSLTSGKPVYVKGSTVPFSQQTLYGMAMDDIMGIAQTTGGRTPSGAISAVKAKKDEIMNAFGLTEADINLAKTQMKGLTATNAALMQTTAYNNLSAKIATDNLELALKASENLPRGGSKLINKYQQWLAGNFTPAGPLADLETYVYTYAREYAKVTSGAAQSKAGLTDSASAEAEKLLNASQSPETFATIANAMKNDMQNVINENNKATASFPDAVKKLFGGLAGDPSGAVAKGNLSANAFVEKALTSHGLKYDDVIAKYKPTLQAGESLAVDNNTGEIIAVTSKDDKSNYTPL